MTVAANLMAIGANQQLVAMKIAESEARAERPQAIEEAKDRKKPGADKKSSENEQARADGALSINHEKEGSLDEVSHQTIQEKRHEAAQSAQTKLAHIEMVNNSAASNQADSTADNEDDEPAPVKPPEIKLPPVQSSVKTSTPEPVGSTPSMGGTLNATTEQAAKDKERELQNNQNKTILTHGEYIGSNEPSFGDTPLNAAMGKSDEPPKIDPFANNSSTAALPGMGAPETPSAASTAADESIMDAIAKDTTQLTGKPAASASPAVNDRESALAAVDAALSAAPPAAAAASPAAQPAQTPTQSTGKSATPTLAELEAAAPASSAPALPPMPDFSTLPPIPPAPTGTPAGLPPVPPLGGGMPSAPVAPEPAAAPQSTGFNPSQFQIPGQK